MLLGFYVAPAIVVDQSDFVWNIGAGPTEIYSPNVLSELDYHDLKSIGYGLEFGYSGTLSRGWSFISMLNYRSTQFESGEVRDSDWIGDNKTSEFSRSKSRIEDDGIESYSIGLGLRTHLFGARKHYFSTMIGIDHSEVNLVATDGVQQIWRPELIGLDPSDFGPGDPIPGLKATYDAEYTSYWVGLGTQHIFQFGVLAFNIRYYQLDYDAVADWNLRAEFAHPVSFRHSTDGHGFDYEFEYSYVINQNWDYFFGVTLRNWDLKGGYDQTYFADGQSSIIRLNGVEWKSTSITTGVKFYF